MSTNKNIKNFTAASRGGTFGKNLSWKIAHPAFNKLGQCSFCQKDPRDPTREPILPCCQITLARGEALDNGFDPYFAANTTKDAAFYVYLDEVSIVAPFYLRYRSGIIKGPSGRTKKERISEAEVKEGRYFKKWFPCVISVYSSRLSYLDRIAVIEACLDHEHCERRMNTLLTLALEREKDDLIAKVEREHAPAHARISCQEWRPYVEQAIVSVIKLCGIDTVKRFGNKAREGKKDRP